MFCTLCSRVDTVTSWKRLEKRRKIKFWSIPSPPPPSFFFFFFFFRSCNVFSARHRIGKDGVKLAKAKVCHIKYLTFSTVVSLQRKKEKGKEWGLRRKTKRVSHKVPNACSSCPYSKTEKRKGWDFTQNTQKDKTCVT